VRRLCRTLSLVAPSWQQTSWKARPRYRSGTYRGVSWLDSAAAGVPVTVVRNLGIIHDVVMLNPLRDTHAGQPSLRPSARDARPGGAGLIRHRHGSPEARRGGAGG